MKAGINLTVPSIFNPQPYTGSGILAFTEFTIPTDVNADGSVDAIDIADIMALNGTPAPPGSPYDVDGDGIITVNDARICTLQCSLPLCAVPPPQ